MVVRRLFGAVAFIAIATTARGQIDSQVAHKSIVARKATTGTVKATKVPPGAITTVALPPPPPPPLKKPLCKSGQCPAARPIAPWIIAGILVLLLIAHGGGVFGPRFHTTMTRPPTRLDTPTTPAGVQHDLTIVTTAEQGATTLELTRASIVLKEGRHHDG